MNLVFNIISMKSFLVSFIILPTVEPGAWLYWEMELGGFFPIENCYTQ